MAAAYDTVIALSLAVFALASVATVLYLTRPAETLARYQAFRRALPALSPARAVRWWLADPDRPADNPAMVAVRIGSRQGDGATTVTALDSIPQRGQVVLHAVLERGAGEHRLRGVLWAMSLFAHRKARGRWACYVTNGSIYGYVKAGAARPVVESVRAPGSVIG